MLTYFKVLLKAFTQLFIIFDPWLLSAFLALVVWLVAKIFPNIILKVVRSISVFAFWVVTIFKWKRCVYKIVLFLEYNFQVEKVLSFFFTNQNDESIHGMLLGIIFFIWFAIGVFLILYELTHWKTIKPKKK